MTRRELGLRYGSSGIASGFLDARLRAEAPAIGVSELITKGAMEPLYAALTRLVAAR